MTDLKIRQACQWGRIFDIFDKNVEKIIMILPLEMSVEIINYYKTIIAIKNIGDFQKIHFIAPEAMNSFPTHNMALSTLLKYSPDAINEIKAIIAPYQKNCYRTLKNGKHVKKNEKSNEKINGKSNDRTKKRVLTNCKTLSGNRVRLTRSGGPVKISLTDVVIYLRFS